MPAFQKEEITQMHMHVLRPARLRSRRMFVTNGNCLFVFMFTVFRTPRSKLVCFSKRFELHVLNLFSFAPCFERPVLNNKGQERFERPDRNAGPQVSNLRQRLLVQPAFLGKKSCLLWFCFISSASFWY